MLTPDLVTIKCEEIPGPLIMPGGRLLHSDLEPPSELRALEIHRRIGMVQEEMAFWRNVNRAVYRERQGRLSALEGELRARLEAVGC